MPTENRMEYLIYNVRLQKIEDSRDHLENAVIIKQELEERAVRTTGQATEYCIYVRLD